jgi:hypothetical protein
MGAASFLVHSAATFGSAHLTLFKKKLVDPVGIEPTTYVMLWSFETSKCRLTDAVYTAILHKIC